MFGPILEKIANVNMMGIGLVIGWSLVILLLVKAQSKCDNFDLRNLLLDNGVVSLSKFAQITALMVSTWGFVYQTTHNGMTEFYFMGYMVCWSGSRLLMAYMQKDKAPTEEVKS
jgi:hypothetical protein